MDEQNNRSLHDRVTALEEAVEKLQTLTGHLSKQLSRDRARTRG